MGMVYGFEANGVSPRKGWPSEARCLGRLSYLPSERSEGFPMEGAELCGASGMDTRVGMGMNRYMVSIASEASGMEGRKEWKN